MVYSRTQLDGNQYSKRENVGVTEQDRNKRKMMKKIERLNIVNAIDRICCKSNFNYRTVTLQGPQYKWNGVTSLSLIIGNYQLFVILVIIKYILQSNFSQRKIFTFTSRRL